MTGIEVFTLTQAFTAFGVALGSLGVIAAVGLAGSAIRGAVARRSATTHQHPQLPSAR